MMRDPLILSLRKLIAAALRPGSRRLLALLSLAAFVNSSGRMGMMFVALYVTKAQGFDVMVMGWLLAGFGIGSVAGSYGAGWLSDSRPARHVLTLGLLGSSISFALLGTATSLPAIALVMVGAGISEGAFRPAYNRVLMSVFPAEAWRGIYSTYLVAANLGVSLAGLMGGILALHGYGIVFAVNSLAALAAAGIATYACRNVEALADRDGADRDGLAPARPGDSRPERAPAGQERAAITPVFLCLCFSALLCALVFGQLRSTYPTYLAERYLIDPTRLGSLFALNGILIVIMQIPLTRLAKRIETPTLACIGVMLFCGGFGLLPFGSGYGFAILSLIIWTLGEILLYPALTAMVGENAGGPGGGRLLGLYYAQFSIGNLIAPLLGAYLYQRWGGSAVWYGALLAGAGVAWLIYSYSPSRKPAMQTGGKV